ncbi:MAG: NAD(P)H-dependent oxidoreductase [Kiloniellaceae bacterium]
MAHALLVFAHPLQDSFCAAIAARASAALTAAGHTVDRLDLYAEAFQPCLTAGERRAYYGEPPDVTGDITGHTSGVADAVARLRAAGKLVLVFPQWWFGMPAILKGWIDRVFQPGVAFRHTPGYGQILPCLDNIDSVLTITTLGSPWWVAELYMRNPVRRQIRSGIVGPCTRSARFRMLNCYHAEKLSDARREAFLARVDKAAGAL